MDHNQPQIDAKTAKIEQREQQLTTLEPLIDTKSEELKLVCSVVDDIDFYNLSYHLR